MARMTAEERAELERRLAEDDAAADDDEPDYDYEIGSGDRYARIPAKSRAGRKVNAWFKDTFGIDLDDEPAQDPVADSDPAAGKSGKHAKQAPAAGSGQQGGQVRAFSRRVG